MRSCRVLVWIWIFGTFFGCGRDLKLSIKAHEADKDGTGAALARKVELSYRDPSGTETLREAIPVLGLSQPVAFQSEKLKKMEWSEGGRFEARAYSSDGLLVLAGASAPLKTDQKEVEVVIGHSPVAGLGAMQLHSAVIRKIHLKHSAADGDQSWDLDRLESTKGRQNCLHLPGIQLKQNQAVAPELAIECSLKAPDLDYEVYEQNGNGQYLSLVPRQSLPVSSNGQPTLEIGSQFLDGRVLVKKANYQVRLFSSVYEGCLEFQAGPSAESPQVTVSTFPGPRQYGVTGLVSPRSTITITNPNRVPLQIHFSATARLSSGSHALQLHYAHSAAASVITDMIKGVGLTHELEVAALSKSEVSVYAAIDPTKTWPESLIVNPFELQWSLSSTSEDTGQSFSQTGIVLVP